MNEENIRKIVDDERAEQLTAQLCRHWEVATRRLAELVQDLEGDMDTCVEAEVYATVMRLQSCVTALMELNKIPCFFLFSEYLERISQTVSNTSIRQSAITLLKRLFAEQPVFRPRRPYTLPLQPRSHRLQHYVSRSWLLQLHCSRI